MHDATKQLNALAGDHKESPLGEHEIALRGSRSADQSGRIKCEERPVACIIQVKQNCPPEQLDWPPFILPTSWKRSVSCEPGWRMSWKEPKACYARGTQAAHPS